MPLTMRPGPMAKEQTRKSAIRGDNSAFVRGNRIFARREPPAANTMSKVVQWPMLRMRFGNTVSGAENPRGRDQRTILGLQDPIAERSRTQGPLRLRPRLRSRPIFAP